MSIQSIQLSKDYISFYENDSKYADVIIRVGKDENVKEFNVHSFILLARSNYFRKKIEEKKENHDVIEIPNINPQLFDQILRYFYGGQLKYKPGEVLDYLLISKELNITGLLESLQYLLLISPNQIYQRFSTTLQISSSYEKLHKFCLKTIQEDPEIIFKSQDFHLLDKDTLLVLLRNKKLNLKEIEKWESIIKWGNFHTFTDAGNFNKMPDISLWTKIKFRDLANTLTQFIPLINFYKIDPDDFYKKVKPFKKILSKQLYDEILKYHLCSNNEQGNPLDTCIIEPKAKVLYDYDAEADDEISLVADTYVTILEKVDDYGWWRGRTEQGQIGLFPSTFVEEIKQQPSRRG